MERKIQNKIEKPEEIKLTGISTHTMADTKKKDNLNTKSWKKRDMEKTYRLITGTHDAARSPDTKLSQTLTKSPQSHR